MKIGLVGASGRMGQHIAQEILKNKNLELSYALVQKTNKDLDKDIGELLKIKNTGIKLSADTKELIANSETIIDFSSPENTIHIIMQIIKLNKNIPYIIGTTGFTPQQSEIIKEASKKLAIIWSANMSVGVNILLGLTKQVAAILGEDFDIEINEAHHKHKVDSPSGTALALGAKAAEGRKVDLKKVMVTTRDGIVGARKSGTIGFSSIRAGDIIGDHTVMFATDGERIELTHKASNRNIFAKGAVQAALWTKTKSLKPALYDMQDVLFG